MVQVFAPAVFFIVFRETLETSIIVSILLAFIKQTLGPKNDPPTYKKLVRQIWLGTGVGVFICVCIGAGMIGAFYGLTKDAWSKAENVWEGSFGLVASIIITAMGAALLRVSKLQAKWRIKLAKALESKGSIKRSSNGRIKLFFEKYAMFILPFITVLREGLEAVIFIGGVGVGQPASAFPIPVIVGIIAGSLIGVFIYKGSNLARIQIFLIASTAFLYLVAAGLFSKAVGNFEANHVSVSAALLIGYLTNREHSGISSVAEMLRRQELVLDRTIFAAWFGTSIPLINGGGGWGVFNSLFGWNNTATYGSVISYNLYWLIVIVGFVLLRIHENRGRRSAAGRKLSDTEKDANSTSGDEAVSEGEFVEKPAAVATSTIQTKTIEG